MRLLLFPPYCTTVVMLYQCRSEALVGFALLRIYAIFPDTNCVRE